MTDPIADLPAPISEQNLANRWNEQADKSNQWSNLSLDEMLDWAQTLAIRYDRARWGRPAKPPAEGEVAELAAYLCSIKNMHCQRAAALLQQQHAEPVPVSERLPDARPESEGGDCDDEGRCWVHQPHEACPESPTWQLLSAKYASESYGALCWLPAHALPLPTTTETSHD